MQWPSVSVPAVWSSAMTPINGIESGYSIFNFSVICRLYYASQNVPTFGHLMFESYSE